MKQPDTEFAAFVGIDWADAKHDICLQAADSARREFSVIAHRPEAIEAWATGLRQRFPGRIAVCLEIDKGPLVYALQRYDFLVLYPVNPATLAKYRQAFQPSRAKDDPADAECALDLLTHHRDKLKALHSPGAPMRILAALVEQRRNLVDDQRRLVNRLTSALKNYYPQPLEWFEDKATVLFCDFIARWSTLKQVQCARRSTLLRFFHEHNVRNASLIEQRLDAIKSARPLTNEMAVIEPLHLLVESLAEQLHVTLAAVERFDEKIAALAPTLPDYALFAALPGAGPTLAPRLLVAFGEQRERYASAAAIQKYSGIAPVTERSGQSCWVHWRWQCPKFLRQSFVEWAGQTVPRSFWAGAYYRQQRARGASHQAALRALAFKWIRILYRCWQTRTAYDEARYLNSLQRHHSPLLGAIAQGKTD
jgi:transposase